MWQTKEVVTQSHQHSPKDLILIYTHTSLGRELRRPQIKITCRDSAVLTSNQGVLKFKHLPANDDVDYNQPSFSGPPAASPFNSYPSSTSSNHNAFHHSSSFQHTSRQSQMFSDSLKHPGRSHQSSDEDEEDNMRASALANKSTGWDIDSKPYIQ